MIDEPNWDCSIERMICYFIEANKCITDDKEKYLAKYITAIRNQLEVRTYFNIVDRIDTSKFDKYIPNKRDYINGKYLTNYGAIIFGKLLIDFGEITEEKIIKTLTVELDKEREQKIIKTTRDVLSKYTDISSVLAESLRTYSRS